MKKIIKMVLALIAILSVIVMLGFMLNDMWVSYQKTGDPFTVAMMLMIVAMVSGGGALISSLDEYL